jgi:hypothetical protein
VTVGRLVRILLKRNLGLVESQYFAAPLASSSLLRRACLGGGVTECKVSRSSDTDRSSRIDFSPTSAKPACKFVNLVQRFQMDTTHLGQPTTDHTSSIAKPQTSNASAGLLMRRFDSIRSGQLSSSIDNSDKGANSNDEEEDTGETWLLNKLLVDGEEQELLLNEEGKFHDPCRMTVRGVKLTGTLIDGQPDSSLDLFLLLADWSEGVSPDLRNCLTCREPRYQTGSTKPQKTFLCLQLQYQDAERARILKSYRHGFTSPNARKARRVFRDGSSTDTPMKFVPSFLSCL